MKKCMFIIFLLVIQILSFQICFANPKISPLPGCTPVGQLHCPKGYNPACPKQYKASCVFVGGKQHPGCLADSPDTTAFQYHLDKITCNKAGLFGK